MCGPRKLMEAREGAPRPFVSMSRCGIELTTFRTCLTSELYRRRHRCTSAFEFRSVQSIVVQEGRIDHSIYIIYISFLKFLPFPIETKLAFQQTRCNILTIPRIAKVDTCIASIRYYMTFLLNLKGFTSSELLCSFTILS